MGLEPTESGRLELERRAAIHAALGEPVRLAIVDDLAVSDRSPKELSERFAIPTNLLAHHLDILDSAGVIERFVSAGDKRRRYVRLVSKPLGALGVGAGRPAGPVVFVCSHNSARSQLAAALWHARTGEAARSAGTHPADAVHPGAVAAAQRIGLDLVDARPSLLGPIDEGELVVTVCDRAHEELVPGDDWWHWSLPDPIEDGSDDAFDTVVTGLEHRIRSVWN
ncbi:MAG: ArsR family transcriptional regulator [Acidimicrobiaceae bacterium]|nr:ArsR family transcriptional regulator [Acidimicrobiaceae bacterium]